ncbi:hypothetical protein Taro_017656 [Colocasia esculenta]|uniref:Uncharacterized protein n=1 Tax=Colocasia esculenta TaxID=4460 RepID=A0A843UNR8_COLES|nr:hypothetical protein [Colocasia esculenta]
MMLVASRSLPPTTPSGFSDPSLPTRGSSAGLEDLGPRHLPPSWLAIASCNPGGHPMIVPPALKPPLGITGKEETQIKAMGSGLPCINPPIKTKETPPNKDAQSDNSWDKALPKRLVGMLDAISPPPAFAAEYPTKSLQSAHHPVALSSRLTAGIVQIRGATMSADGKNWFMPKDLDAGFVLFPGITSTDVTGYNGPALRESSFKIGVYVCTRLLFEKRFGRHLGGVDIVTIMDGKVSRLGAESADSESGRPLATRFWGGNTDTPMGMGGIGVGRVDSSRLGPSRLCPGRFKWKPEPVIAELA